MLLVVGELINSTRKSVGAAIRDRNEEHIRDLARRQMEAGANIIDVNAGQSMNRELEDLLWLIGIVEDELGPEIRLGIDTSNPDVMKKAIATCSGAPLMNSISNEPSKAPLIEVAAACGCDVIGLAMGEKGMPLTSDARFGEAAALAEKCTAAGLDLDHLYIDLICMSVASSPEQGRELLSAVRKVKRDLKLKTVGAVSNVSFGLPNRRLLNRTFFSMLIEAGLDAAIVDPTDPGIVSVLCASDALLGTDDYCMKYIQQYRTGKQI